ncbi:GNAT family N-acetyltransferase [Streptomyces sp. NPDC020983]|uniref:GNAT family N-acetyltransferase n=1 Tax=Streptomyces sp. NPDC020983 TaxID=3365106 RepID=UPI00379E115B
MSEKVVRVDLAAWGEDDFPLLEQTNTPEMTDHLGGPESPQALEARHRRYLALPKGGMFRVVTPEGETAGAIGYWEREWRGGPVWETGWSVLPAHQGRGIAAAAAREIIRTAREADGNRYLHAFPSVDHPASNGVCRKAGFELLEEVSFEYPKGSWMTCNDWRIDLQSPAGPTAG